MNKFSTTSTYEPTLNGAHIDEIEVYTGNDDGEQTDAINFTVLNNEHGVPELRGIRNKNQTSIGVRVRGEPCVAIKIVNEGTDFGYSVINIYHHKGSIYIIKEVYEGGRPQSKIARFVDMETPL